MICLLKSGPTYLQGSARLQVLSLRRNRLSLLPANLFAGLSQLQKLDLSSNRLSLLPVNFFSGLVANVFGGLSQLQELDLGGQPSQSVAC